MMDERYRFTGEWPPVSLLQRFPNWEYALDEEEVDGQDETTIRPEEQQTRISANTAYTGAKAHFADGRILDAIVEALSGDIRMVVVLLDDNQC